MGYWDHTANIEWCEYILHPYQYSYYIAEFWNTLSSLIIIIIGIWELYRRYFEANLIIPIITTGLGSTIFHATQSYIGQVIDELSMVLIAFVLLCQLYRHNIKIINYLQFLVFSLIYIRTLSFALFITCFSILVVLIIGKCYDLNRINKTHNRILMKGIFGFTTAVLLWISERMVCYEDSMIDIWHFHALWHLLSIISLRYILIFAHCTSKRVVFRKPSVLREVDFVVNIRDMV